MKPAILVTFCPRTNQAEKLALAAGVGAVQARAGIRLRCLTRGSGPDSQPGDSLERTSAEYIPPSEDDVAWADALVFCPARGADTSGAVWEGYLDLLGRMSAERKLDGKIAAVTGPPSDSVALVESMLSLGLIVLPHAPPATSGASDEILNARVQGRRLAMIVRSADGGVPTWDDAAGLL